MCVVSTCSGRMECLMYAMWTDSALWKPRLSIMMTAPLCWGKFFHLFIYKLSLKKFGSTTEFYKAKWNNSISLIYTAQVCWTHWFKSFFRHWGLNNYESVTKSTHTNNCLNSMICCEPNFCSFCRSMILRELAPQLSMHVPPELASLEVLPIVPTTYGTM